MKLQIAKPTGRTSPFHVNELFFSTTDSRGVIQSGNEVFARTSGFVLDELIGQPHNIIRHPDMPRAAFAAMWSTLKSGRPFLGYVKNQSRNGDHYWVFVLVSPITGGYLSVRFKPTTSLLDTVENLYANLLAAENDAISKGATQANAADASLPLLEAAVRKLGYDSYEALSWAALNAEIKARDVEIATRKLRLFPAEVPVGTDRISDCVGRIFRQAHLAYNSLNSLFANIDTFAASRDAIAKRSAAVLDLADEFRLNALNAHIASEPLGHAGVTLSTVATFLNEYSRSLTGNVSTLTSNIKQTTAALEGISANVSAARLILEVSLVFQAELAGRSQDEKAQATAIKMLGELGQAFSDTITRAERSFALLQTSLPMMASNNEAMRKDIVGIQVAQISGLTEASRIPSAEHVRSLFVAGRSQVSTVIAELAQLSDVVDQLHALAAQAPDKVTSISGAHVQIQSELQNAA